MFRRPAPTLARMPAQRNPKQTLQSVNTLNARNQAGTSGPRFGPGQMPMIPSEAEMAALQNSATQRPAQMPTQMPSPGAVKQSIPGAATSLFGDLLSRQGANNTQTPSAGATSQSVPGMGLAGMPKGGATFKKGGKVKASSASKRADGCAVRGKTKGKMV
jgi:hypothetical protein